MITIDWSPIAHVGPIPINWYGLTWALGFLIGAAIVRRHAGRYGMTPTQVENAVLWIAPGSMLGVRGNVPVVAWGLKNGQWTAIAILLVALPMFMARWHRRQMARVA